MKKVRPKIQRSAEDRARHQAIREKFRNWHPSPEELIATGEGAKFVLQGEYRELHPFVAEIKRAREAAGLTLAEGISALWDRPAGPFSSGKWA